MAPDDGLVADAADAHCQHTIGFLLQDKKVHRVLTTSLIESARGHGLHLVRLDPNAPLEMQVPQLTALVHKLPGVERLLQQLRQQHPRLLVIDDPAAVRVLHDRGRMLNPVQGSGVLLQPLAGCTDCAILVRAPRQLALHLGTRYEEAAQQLQDAGLAPPMLAKALHTGDAAGSDAHALAVVCSHQGIRTLLEDRVQGLAPPLLLQEYVPHGEHLWKVYVLGPHAVLARRATLTPWQLEAAARAVVGGVHVLQRISSTPPPTRTPPPATVPLQQAAAGNCTTRATDASVSAAQLAADARTSTSSAAEQVLVEPCVATAPCAPPLWMLQQLAAVLRQRLNLNLFNIDLLWPPQPPQQQQQQLQERAEASPEPPQQAASSTYGTPAEAAASLAAEDTAAGGAPPGTAAHAYVVDVNYFPGYDKVAGAEALLADYLAGCCRRGATAWA